LGLIEFNRRRLERCKVNELSLDEQLRCSIMRVFLFVPTQRKVKIWFYSSRSRTSAQCIRLNIFRHTIDLKKIYFVGLLFEGGYFIVAPVNRLIRSLTAIHFIPECTASPIFSPLSRKKGKACYMPTPAEA